MARIKNLHAVLICSAMLSACGTYVPSKDLLSRDSLISEPSDANSGASTEGAIEANLVGNIRCEIQNGLYLASKVKYQNKNNVPYLATSWGTQVTLKLTWDELSGFSPGLSFIHPMSSSQSKSIGVGAAATAHATRVETITFLYENWDLMQSQAADMAKLKGELPDCSVRETGTMIHSDLKIAEFIVDKATLASTGIATDEEAESPPFSTFQEELTFVGSFGGNLTPVWKLTRFTADATANLLSGTRTTTGDVLITLGPLVAGQDGTFLHKLADPAASQHTAAFGGGVTATQVNSQTH